MISNTHTGSFNLTFKNEYIIYENIIRCNVGDDEYNFTQNPTITNSDNDIKEFALNETFSPYVTTIGLYNEANELLAVGKLGSPINIPKSNDITFIIRYDK
jgi:hypothetical protein